jgi:hypothetical protein
MTTFGPGSGSNGSIAIVRPRRPTAATPSSEPRHVPGEAEYEVNNLRIGLEADKEVR